MFSSFNPKRSSSREQTARWIENLTNGSTHSEEEKRELRALARHFRAPETAMLASSLLFPEFREIT